MSLLGCIAKGNHIPLSLPLLSFCISVSLCLCGGFFSTVKAAEVRTLTLDQALEIAAARNRDILKAREFYKQVQGKYMEERSAALPQITLTGQLSRQQNDSQKILTGGFIPTRQDTGGAELGISQVVYSWGKVGAAIRAADIGFRTADERLRMARQGTYRDVSTAFYDILLARELHAISRQNLEQKSRHLDEAQRKYTAGVATDYDILAAEVSVQNARPDLIRTGNQLRSTKDRLRFILALEEDVDVVGALELTPAGLPSYEESLAIARKHRPELEELRRRKEIAGELVTIANADDKPRLDIKGGYGWRRLAAGDARGDGQDWNVGLYLSFPFFDGLKTRGKVAQAESELHALEIDEAKQADAISLEIRDALNHVREAQEIVTALTGTVEQAERLLIMAEKGYELGVKIRLEVDDAELNLNQAKGNLALARRDYLAALVNLNWTTGVLGEGNVPASSP
ncbi:MAG: TolC family protein [Geobacter sp.]|nr:MAG: TolC family protein [Geobacter sp.]